MWRGMSDKDKKKYIELEKTAKENYLKQKEEYERNAPSKPAATKKKEKKTKEAKKNSGPKRAWPPFFFYQQDRREVLKKENPDKTHKNIVSMLGEEWRNLSEEKKQPYVDKSLEDQKRYEKEKNAAVKESKSEQQMIKEKEQKKSAESGKKRKPSAKKNENEVVTNKRQKKKDIEVEQKEAKEFSIEKKGALKLNQLKQTEKLQAKDNILENEEDKIKNYLKDGKGEKQNKNEGLDRNYEAITSNQERREKVQCSDAKEKVNGDNGEEAPVSSNPKFESDKGEGLDCKGSPDRDERLGVFGETSQPQVNPSDEDQLKPSDDGKILQNDENTNNLLADL